MKHYPFLILFLCSLSFVSKAQINDQLQVICDSMAVEKDTTCYNCDSFAKDRKYKITIDEDTLTVLVDAVDQHRTSKDPRDRHVYVDIYKVNVHDLDRITFKYQLKKLYDLEWEESYVEIAALRDYPLIKHNYRGSDLETAMFKIWVINQQDTVHFKQLASLLNTHLSLDSNTIPPSCEVESHTLNTSPPQRKNLIENHNLEEAIQLDRSTDLNEELKKILLPYLVKENIMKVYGDLVINSNNEMMSFESFQNDMYNELQSMDSIPVGYRVMRETGYLKITNEQKLEIVEMLKNQNWTAGKCNGKSVDAYFDFIVENENYIEE